MVSCRRRTSDTHGEGGGRTVKGRNLATRRASRRASLRASHRGARGERQNATTAAIPPEEGPSCSATAIAWRRSPRRGADQKVHQQPGSPPTRRPGRDSSRAAPAAATRFRQRDQRCRRRRLSADTDPSPERQERCGSIVVRRTQAHVSLPGQCERIATQQCHTEQRSHHRRLRARAEHQSDVAEAAKQPQVSI